MDALEVFLGLTLPGAAGGMASFFLALSRGTIRERKYVRKFLIEVAGAMLTATFITPVFIKIFTFPTIVLAFIVGLCWSKTLQVIRIYVTKKVEDELKKIDKNKEDKE
jgi:hypothetical protein